MTDLQELTAASDTGVHDAHGVSKVTTERPWAVFFENERHRDGLPSHIVDAFETKEEADDYAVREGPRDFGDDDWSLSVARVRDRDGKLEYLGYLDKWEPLAFHRDEEHEATMRRLALLKRMTAEQMGNALAYLSGFAPDVFDKAVRDYT